MNDKQPIASLNSALVNYARQSCKIPKEYDQMIVDIVSRHTHSLRTALGNLELCYRRTLMHAEEFREMEKQQVKI